jgi:hypothetical protein
MVRLYNFPYTPNTEAGFRTDIISTGTRHGLFGIHSKLDPVTGALIVTIEGSNVMVSASTFFYISKSLKLYGLVFLDHHTLDCGNPAIYQAQRCPALSTNLPRQHLLQLLCHGATHLISALGLWIRLRNYF